MIKGIGKNPITIIILLRCKWRLAYAATASNRIEDFRVLSTVISFKIIVTFIRVIHQKKGLSFLVMSIIIRLFNSQYSLQASRERER